jgi:hypothetical protein
MNLLFPTFPWRLLPRMLGIALFGAMISGGYGILHDQVTYSISGEYFTKLKFDQFRYAHFGFPVRVLVGEIGFLATWWVGFFGGWFLARLTVPFCSAGKAWSMCRRGFLVMIGAALLAGLTGHLLGAFHSPDYSFWADLCEQRGIVDVPAFVHVGLIHNASYLGGLVGLVAAIVLVLRWRRAEQRLPAEPDRR